MITDDLEKGEIMKKLSIMFYVLIAVLMINVCVYAADEVRFEVAFEGTVVEEQEKDVEIVLVGEGAPLYSKVRVKVDISGPATPKLLATDSIGTQIDIAQVGYWGPEAGFAIQGDFTNTTPVKATFDTPGDYTITLSLLNLENANAVLTTKTIAITVVEKETPVANIIENATTTENETIENATNEIVTQLPQTGTSLTEYAIYFVLMVALIFFIYRIKQKSN